MKYILVSEVMKFRPKRNFELILHSSAKDKSYSSMLRGGYHPSTRKLSV